MRRVVHALALALALAPVAAGGAGPAATVGAASSGGSGLEIAASRSSGSPPLVVTFRLRAPRALSWRLDFGDGRTLSAEGAAAGDRDPRLPDEGQLRGPPEHGRPRGQDDGRRRQRRHPRPT